jgi:hypothetical protein
MKGQTMTPAERISDKDHPQGLSDEDRMKAAMEALEKENRSLKDLVVQLSTLIIRRVTGKQ